VNDLMVRAENVHKSFGHLQVLKGIDLAVRPGEVSVVIGPSGSGKSTFLRCVNHLEKINAGRIWVDGELIGYRERGGKLHELREKEVAAQRRSIGMVFQRFNLFPHMTALANVMEAPGRVRHTHAVHPPPGRLDRHDRRAHAGAVHIRAQHERALTREPLRDGSANPRGRPGHNAHLALHPHVRSSFFGSPNTPPL